MPKRCVSTVQLARKAHNLNTLDVLLLLQAICRPMPDVKVTPTHNRPLWGGKMKRPRKSDQRLACGAGKTQAWAYKMKLTSSGWPGPGPGDRKSTRLNSSH